MTIPPIGHEVASFLESWCSSGGPCDFSGPTATVNHYARDAGRPVVVGGIINDYLDRQTDVRADGRAAILTAGVPGAGKSTALERAGFNGPGWRRLDADIIKTQLIEVGLADGIFADLLSEMLPDQYPVLPLELASLVHRESVEIIDIIRRRCMADGENILIEGTLAYKPYGERLVTELAVNDYLEVTILDIEVDEETAKSRALSRWWTGRQDCQSGHGHLGGRFTPARAITSSIENGISSCRRTAQALFDSDLAAEFRSFDLIVEDHVSDAGATTRQRKVDGELVIEDPSSSGTE